MVQRLVAVNSKNEIKHVTLTEMLVTEEGNKMELAFNLLSNKRLLIQSELNSNNAQILGGYLNALRNLESL